MRTRIKFCGITRAEDAQCAVALGVDALGFVFYPPSPRALDLEKAVVLARAVPPFVTRVALFLDEDKDAVEQIIRHFQPDLLQFHGSESAAYCRSFDRPYIKALACGEGSARIDLQIKEHAAATGFLLDSHSPGQAGGSGVGFDWSQVPAGLDRPMLLAGGLNANNVASAIGILHPYAVDVSSGVESAPGIKDSEKMLEFVEQVRLADGT